MSETSPWPNVGKDGRWTTELMEELLEETDQAPEQLSARAQELRAEAERTDIEGHREAVLALAERYEAAATRVATS